MADSAPSVVSPAFPSLINPREARDLAKPYLLDLGTGRAVMVKRVSLHEALYEGVAPMPLLRAASKLVERRDKGQDEIDQLNALTTSDRRESREMLEKFAAMACVQPQVVVEDTGDPDTLPAHLLSTVELLAIWNSAAVLPKVAAAKAEEFRVQPVSTDADAAPDGQDVRPTAEPVVPPEGPEVIGG